MRFLISFYVHNAYGLRSMEGLREGILALGENHTVEIAKTALTPTTSETEWAQCDADVVLAVNVPRSPALPKNVRYICWIQDVFPGMEKAVARSIQPNDLIYIFGDPDLLGIRREWPCFSSTLFPGVSTWWAAEPPSVAQDLDMSVVGYIPDANNPLFTSFPDPAAFRAQVKAIFQPLSGSLNVRPFFNTFQDPQVQLAVREYARLLDRAVIGAKMLEVTRNVAFYGVFWERFREFAPYANPPIEDNEGLRRVYQRTAVNLSTNPNGLGCHPRQLECMAARGFVMTNRSPMENLPGGMRAHFEPGVHFGEYTADDFAESTRRWLQDADARHKVGQAARERVLSAHTWRHRARQIISDLAR